VNQIKDLYSVSLVAPDQRKSAAISLITKDLQDADIPIDENVTALINLLIEDMYQIPKLAVTSNVAAITAAPAA
jgi:hypothetical protein